MLDLSTIDKSLLVATKAKEGSNIVTPICRISFPQVFEPNASDSMYDPGKYTLTILIPNIADISLLKSAAAEVAREKWGDKVKDIKLTSPFIDAGEQKKDGYIPGWTMMRVKTKRKPSIVDPNIRDATGKFVPITEDDGSSVYPGRWARVSVNAFAYDKPKNGISFSLNNIMLLHHDESLSGKAQVENEFEAPAGYSSGAAASDGKPAAAKTANDLF